MKMSNHRLLATMIVGVLAMTFSWSNSDTKLSVGRLAEAYAAEKTEPLDLNTATEEQLKALPGIGDAYSKKIIKHRPYTRKDELVQNKRKDELLQKKVIPQATYDKIKDQIVAKQK